MKKFISLVLVLVLCLSLACPAFAAETTFVPSISYKDGPDADNAELKDENVGGCLVITSITEAKNKSTDITQDDRDLLLYVYDQLKSGDMKLPLENDEYVIRELVDVNFKEMACVNPGHQHEEVLEETEESITIVFNLGVAKDTNVVVMKYHEGAWENIKSVVNNGDGTVTCVFDHFCPVVFCVEADAADVPAQTGDAVGQNLMLWVVLMVASLAAVVVLLARRRKHA